MKRLVAVSNRVGPIRGAAQAGGLAVALVDVLRERGGLWFGWSGKTCRNTPGPVSTELVDGVQLAQIDLGRDDYEGYYNGFANLCLWPLLHLRVDLVRYHPDYLSAYRRVNEQFARALLPLLNNSDLLWIHDYHLIPMAAMLRTLGVRQRIGFFLHTSFPPADLLATLPNHDQLMRYLFDYDLIGFQTEPDLHRFHDYVRRFAGGRVRGHRVAAYGASVDAGAFPIGIDARTFGDLACSAIASREHQKMRQVLQGRELIIGVDRLDYTKGLLRRLAAYELMLERFPGAHRRIEYLQISPISRGEIRAYREFHTEMDQAVAHINGRFAQVDWTPLRYLNRPLQRRALAGLYRASRIGLVTPMRDGMNLVAKEYVAAQDPEDPGVLVLSRFAGAAQQMKDALLVNPYDSSEMADALLAAHRMGIEERRNRHAPLLRRLLQEDIGYWRESFLQRLKACPTAGSRLQ